MKTCPTCGNGFSDDLDFCLQDGTRLIGGPTSVLANRQTEIYHPETNKNTDISTAPTIVSDSNIVSPPPTLFQMSAVEPSRRMGCVLTIGQVAAGLLVVAGLGLAGIIYKFRDDPDVAYYKHPNSNATNTIAANRSANTMANAGNFVTRDPISNTSNETANTASPPTNHSAKTISGGVLNGKAIALPSPPYPAAARAVRASGSVNVQVLIDETGRVVSANAVSGHPLLRQAAAEAARAARFSPTLLGGQSVKVSGIITYNFVP